MAYSNRKKLELIANHIETTERHDCNMNFFELGVESKLDKMLNQFY